MIDFEYKTKKGIVPVMFNPENEEWYFSVVYRGDVWGVFDKKEDVKKFGIPNRENYQTLFDNYITTSKERTSTMELVAHIREEKSLAKEEREVRLQDINDIFNAELQKHIAGTLPKGHIYQLGKAGDILQSASVANLFMELSAVRLEMKASKNYKQDHPFHLSEIKNLPKAINNPIAIFDSTKKDDSKVILTELQHDKDNFIAVMRVRESDESRNINIEVNSVRSLYPKDNVLGIIDWINSEDNLLKWVNREKALDFISTQSTNLIAGGNKIQGFLGTKVRKNIRNAKQAIRNFQNPMILRYNPSKLAGVELPAEIKIGEKIKIPGFKAGDDYFDGYLEKREDRFYILSFEPQQKKQEVTVRNTKGITI